MKKVLVILIIALLSCNNIPDAPDSKNNNSELIDTPVNNEQSENPEEQNINNPTNESLTEETIKLRNKLSNLGSTFIFGQANARTLSANYSGAKNTNINQSDAKDITGSHPGFIESDFMWYSDDPTFKTNDINSMVKHSTEGGIIGYTWHFRDSENSFYSTSGNNTLVADIISNHNGTKDWFYGEIDKLAIPTLTIFNNKNIPVIVRPFHEMNGNWFWWGNKSTSDYIALYKLFVDYIRDTKKLNNILYAWSPHRSLQSSYYPGDNYVDIIGIDFYEPTYEDLKSELTTLINFANERSKIGAITETGFRDNNNNWNGDITKKPTFWTDIILKAISSNTTTAKTAYVMAWYNAKWNSSNLNAYTPYKGISNQTCIDDFRSFKNNNSVLFLDEYSTSN